MNLEKDDTLELYHKNLKKHPLILNPYFHENILPLNTNKSHRLLDPVLIDFFIELKRGDQNESKINYSKEFDSKSTMIDSNFDHDQKEHQNIIKLHKHLIKLITSKHNEDKSNNFELKQKTEEIFRFFSDVFAEDCQFGLDQQTLMKIFMINDEEEKENSPNRDRGGPLMWTQVKIEELNELKTEFKVEKATNKYERQMKSNNYRFRNAWFDSNLSFSRPKKSKSSDLIYSSTNIKPPKYADLIKFNSIKLYTEFYSNKNQNKSHFKPYFLRYQK
jgi:hypothetical protein